MTAPSGRITRSRAGTPLPALQPKQSHAYGAQGKASLQQQVTTSNEAMDSVFQAGEKTPAAKPRPSRVPKASEPPESVATAKPPAPPSASEDDAARPETSLATMAPYGPAPAPPPRRRREDFEPHWIKILFWTLWHYAVPSSQFVVVVVFCCTILLGLISAGMTVYIWAPLPNSMASQRDRFVQGQKHALGYPGHEPPPSEAERLWLDFRVQKWFENEIPINLNVSKWQWAVNKLFKTRIDQGEQNMTALQSQVGLHHDSILEFQRILPNYVAVTQTEDGGVDIPTLFWKGLLQKMQSDDSSPLWDRFLDFNEDKIQALTNAAIDSNIDQIAANHHLINQDEFQKALVANNKFVEENLNETLRYFQANVLREAKVVAQQAATEIVEKTGINKLARHQITALAHANLIHNTDDRMREINFFSLGMGALVDPYLTSRTFRFPSLTRRLVHRLLVYVNLIPDVLVRPHSPAMALRPWEEATNCWCSVTGDDYKAQIGVRMGFKIHPQSLIVEHVPSMGTVDIAAAPKDMEVWAQMEPEEEAERMTKELARRVAMWEDFKCGEQPVAYDEKKNWVCIGNALYDIHDNNYVQNFSMIMDMKDLGLATRRVVVRATENWGSKDHTCLYRLRLVGERADVPV